LIGADEAGDYATGFVRLDANLEWIALVGYGEYFLEADVTHIQPTGLRLFTELLYQIRIIRGLSFYGFVDNA